MRNVNLRNAILTGNDMRLIDMRDSDLSHAVLRCNDMTGTDMGFTYMSVRTNAYGTCSIIETGQKSGVAYIQAMRRTLHK